MTKHIAKHPVFKLFGVAGVLWLGVVFYSYGVFHHTSFSQTDVGEHPKHLHPAGEFLRNAKKTVQKSLGKTRQESFPAAVTKRENTRTLQEQAEEACTKTMDPAYVQECKADVEKLNMMNPPIAHHYIMLLLNRKEKDQLLKGKIAEHPCMKINSETHRAECYRTVFATTDFNVAQKIATLIYETEDLQPVGVTLHDAKIACALAIEKANCIHDVMGTGDLESAEIYDKQAAPEKNEKTGKMELQAHHHKMTKNDAIQACKMVHVDDQKYCQEHVMKLDDEETAEHYVHLLQDAEAHLSPEGTVMAGTISKEDGSTLCNAMKNAQYKDQCLKDIMGLPNKHVADHFVELYDLTSKVTEVQAEKLCNHLSRSHHNHETCIETLVKMANGSEAASHYSALLKSQRDQLASDMNDSKHLLTKVQSITVCQDVQPKSEQDACHADVQTMNDLVMAQKYAQWLTQKKK